MRRGEARWWAGVCARDERMDGVFVYAVKTTGIFCRASCAARLPLVKNVEFFADVRAATKAGYRACKRCKPEQISPQHMRAAMVARLCRLIETSESVLTLSELSREAQLSPFHVHRVFTEVTGVTPRAYGEAHRLKRVHKSLRTASSITSAIFDSGYNTSSRFYEKSNKVLGMTPTRFRRGAKNVCIRFAFAKCSLGHILVATTPKGVCAIDFGDSASRLLTDLRERFPYAAIEKADAPTEKLLHRLVKQVENPRKAARLPLDIQGTAFQQRVWAALTQIPVGETRSYAELAQHLGMPNSARAIGQACAANVLAVAIPCHRVVRTNGDLSGYRWGLSRKQTLLDREQR